MHPYSAWLAARILIDDIPDPDEMELVGGWEREFLETLAAAPSEGRQAALSELVRDRPDGPAILRSIAEAQPTGPPPTPSELSEGWGPLRLGELPPVDPFPIDVFPDPVARLVRDGAKAIGCVPDFLAMAALAVAAGVIGRSVSLRLKDNYFARSSIFAASVGPPSDGKSPAQKAVAAAVRRIDEELEAEYARAIQEWSDRCKELPKKDAPPPPKPRRIDVDDITMEAIPPILADNPRGVAMIRDELAALLKGLNQYKSGGKGSDRPMLLKLWSGDAIKKDRVNHQNYAPIRCAHPCISILGGMTPDSLDDFVDPKGRVDGFLERFLLVFPDPGPVPPWTDAGLPDEVDAEWEEIIRRLWLRPMNVKDGRSVPHVAHFTPEAKAAWERHYNAHIGEMNAPDFLPTLRGYWGKLREYAGRLALDLACLWHASDPLSNALDVPRVDAATVERAWILIDYFKSGARRVYAALALGIGGSGGPAVKVMIEWIRAGRRLSFSEHEFKQDRRKITDADRESALAYLIERNAVRRRSDWATTPKGGRPHSPVWEVNPAVHRSEEETARPPGDDVGSEGFKGFEEAVDGGSAPRGSRSEGGFKGFEGFEEGGEA
jgi:hypothetical protein